jgi:hypothetical protein
MFLQDGILKKIKVMLSVLDIIQKSGCSSNSKCSRIHVIHTYWNKLSIAEDINISAFILLKFTRCRLNVLSFRQLAHYSPQT